MFDYHAVKSTPLNRYTNLAGGGEKKKKKKKIEMNRK
jgi:hypothetical protein